MYGVRLITGKEGRVRGVFLDGRQVFPTTVEVFNEVGEYPTTTMTFKFPVEYIEETELEKPISE